MSKLKKTSDTPVHIKDLLYLFLLRWYWFVISVLVCVSVVIVYIAVTPPTYTRHATVLIKGSTKSGSVSSGKNDALNELGLFMSNVDVKTEAHVFKSPQLMEIVVGRLKLEKDYRTKFKKIRYVDLYDSTPVIIENDSLLNTAVMSFTVKFLPSRKLLLSDIIVDGVPVEGEVRGKLSEPIALGHGTITVIPTVFYRETDSDIYFTKHPVKVVANQCKNLLNVSVSDDETPIIQLSYVDVNPQRAEDILNMLISVYNENLIKDKNQMTASTSEFINDRLKVIESELGSIDNDISDYKSKNLLPDLNAVSGMYLTQSSNNSSRLLILQNQLSMAYYIQSYMNDATRKNRLLPANTGIDNGGIEGQIDQYNTILLQKNNLVANSTEKNPVVVDMNQTLGFLREAILNSVHDYISKLNIQLNNVRKEEKITNQKIASNPNQAKHLLIVERQQKVKEELYLFLLQKREENELAQIFTAHNTKIVNSPGGSADPTAPRKKNLLLGALCIGLLVPGIILFFRESLNTLIRDQKDLESLDLPFLGEIPNISKSKKYRETNEQKVAVVVEDKNRNVINEAFRNISTTIDFMRLRTDFGTVIMVTSLNPGNGKTFTSINTALSMAIKGERVIVLDADLRKVSLSSLLRSPQKGITDYLAGNVDSWSDLICKGEVHPKLDVLPVGKLPPNPSELLMSERFIKLINQLKQEYNYVFLDCPPAMVVTDTSIVGPMCDLTMFVIRAGAVDKRALPNIEQIYLKGQIKNMAIVLNGIDLDSFHYRKYGYGRYEYGK